MFLKTHLLASSGSYGGAEAILAPQHISAGDCTTHAWSERWPSLCATAGSSPEVVPRASYFALRFLSWYARNLRPLRLVQLAAVRSKGRHG